MKRILYILCFVSLQAISQSELITVKVPLGNQVVSVAQGGTGQTTASGSFNSIAPSKTGNALKFLRVNAGETDYELATIAGGGDMLASNNLSDLINVATARLNLGSTTVGSNLFTLANPSAVRYIRTNNDNTITLRTSAEMLLDIGAQPTLISATNIKTINGSSVLGSGDLVVSGGVAWGAVTGTLGNQTDLQAALDLKANLASPTFTGTVSGITKSMVGLGNVDNTTDAGKPVSTATQTALDAKQATLVSGTNIKTVNGNSLLGSGDIAIAGGEAFPVGSVFISVVSTNPATLLGYGTWSAFGAGRVLVGLDAGDADFDVAEETGGSKTVTIGASNLPQLSVNVTDPGHTHLTQRYPTATGGSSGFTIDASMSGTLADNTLPTKTNTTGVTATANTGGANTPISIVQSYITVYMWKRTL